MLSAPRSWFLCLLALSLLASLTVPGPAAHAGVWAKPLGVCILRDTGAMDPRILIRQPGRFDCTTPQYLLGRGDFWVVSSDIDQVSAEGDPLRARIASTWQERLTLHIFYADGEILSSTTDRRGVTPLIQLGATVEQPIPTRKARVTRLLWHVEGAANVRGVVLGAELMTEKESSDSNLVMAALYAGFAGLCAALILYNLALWGALRHRFQLLYCLMAACLMLYIYSSSGAMAWSFPNMANNDRLRLNYLLVGLTGASALIFARSFFEGRIFSGWLGRYTDAVALAVGASGMMVFFAAPFTMRIPDAIFTAMFLGLATIVGPLLWRAWRLRDNYMSLFAAAWSLPILIALVRTLANMHVLPWSFWLDNSTVLSAATEIVMSALAISYRIRLLRDERDDAIAAEVMVRRLANTDPLTGLLNRRAFMNQALGRVDDQQLLVVDLDHFKRINETLGHDGGDEVLRLFARIMRTNLPADTLIARMGGEEFAILAPASSPIEPETLLARLRVARMPFDIVVTASIGVCTGPLVTERDWKALYRGADAALFEAKAAGRDRARAAARRAA